MGRQLMGVRYLFDQETCELRMRNPLLEGSWDSVLTYRFSYTPTYNPPNWTYAGYSGHK